MNSTTVNDAWYTTSPLDDFRSILILEDDIGRDGAVRCDRSDTVGRPILLWSAVVVTAMLAECILNAAIQATTDLSACLTSLSATENVCSRVVSKTTVDPVDHNYLLCIGAMVDVLRYHGRSRVFSDRPTLGLDSPQIARGRRRSGIFH